MTIAVVVKVNDGFVLAADSATTVSVAGEDGKAEVLNIYNNANKIFNLHKGLPIGAMTWGLGNIGPASISTLAKELRQRFCGGDQRFSEWKIDPDNYSMVDVAARVHEFLEEKYAPEAAAVGDGFPALGFLVGGYSSLGDQAEIFVTGFGDPSATAPAPIIEDSTGASWYGQPEAITRLMLGISGALPQALINMGMPAGEAPGAVEAIKLQVQEQLVSPAMPIQDAIELAEFLVEATIKFVRFSPGSPTVGGPIEVASITKYEGFKWVARKHYFDPRLNPPQEHP